MGIFNRPDRTGLIGSTGVAIVAALAVNGLIGIVNPSEMSSSRLVAFEPPGYVIGIVWTGLFAALGFARWLLLKKPGQTVGARRLILALLLFCLAYPVYTMGLRSEVAGLVGNLLTMALAIFTVIRVSGISRIAAALVGLVPAWVGFASFLIVEQIRGAGR